MRYTYAVDGQVLKQESIDAGNKWALANAVGSPLRAWDALEHRTRVELDVLQRPTHVWVKKGSGAEWLATCVLYGESVATPETNNLRGKAVLTFDGAGLVETASFDFKGNALTWSRRLATAITTEPDWTPVAHETTPSGALTAAASLLENETWTKAFTYDALSRVTSATMPDSSELLPSYNEAGLLDGVDVKIRGASTATTFVDDIDYDAHGRRTRIEYGNTTATEYSYDELTFRLTRIKSTRSTDSKTLQDLRYTYDPVGNILEVHDDAHEHVFYNDAQVEATGKYEYDAMYRLIQATGREHSGGVGDAQRDQNDLPLWNLPHPNDAAALRRYVEEYTYDKVGNLLEFAHEGFGGPSGATWTRTYRYDTGVTSGYANNRLHSTSEPGSAWASYTHDANGNMVAMPHLAAIDYTHRDQMHHADLGGGGDAYYTYDGGGERVRKFIQRTGTTTEERIYLGGWELYRKRVGTGQDIEVERETLHVMDDTRRVAMVETLTVDDEDPVSPVVSRVRYQYGNHLDSAMLECDVGGDVISYEEYHPYGTAAYRSAKSGVEVSERRYRYTGKERDEETGFSYHQWRYYAPWLSKWTSADPKGPVDALALYSYVRGSPKVFRDPNGAECEPGAGGAPSSCGGDGGGRGAPPAATTAGATPPAGGLAAPPSNGNKELGVRLADVLPLVVGCSPTGGVDKSSAFVEKALSIKRLGLNRGPLDKVQALSPTILRQGDNAEKIAGGTDPDGKGMSVGGALADAVHNNAATVAAGTAKSEDVAKFAQAMGVLYHEATHATLLPVVGTSAEPSWYKKELANFELTAENQYRSTPQFQYQVERVVDEAVGGYVEKAVTQILYDVRQARTTAEQGRGLGPKRLGNRHAAIRVQ